MDDPVSDISLIFRRSRTQTNLVMIVDRVGEIGAGELADEMGITHSRLKEALEGVRPAFAPERSLIACGYVRMVKRGRRRVVAITPKGRLVAEMFRHWERDRVARRDRPAAPHPRG